MAKIRTPTEKELAQIKDLVRYEWDTGKLFWTKRVSSNAPEGKEIRRLSNNGYYRVHIKGREYKASRVAWFLYYQLWPDTYIDHINGNRSDNRIVNLRVVTDSGNKQNRPVHRTGQPVGVVFRSRAKKKKWEAHAPCNYLNRRADKQKWLGNFETKEEAAKAVIDFCTKEE